jgi:hypothetical protein
MHAILISGAFSTSSEIGFLKIGNTEDMILKTFSTTACALDSHWLKIRFGVPTSWLPGKGFMMFVLRANAPSATNTKGRFSSVPGRGLGGSKMRVF